ncbi:hypothetical protein GBAR_LOCUS4921 [Geodia barretti]|uniref:Peptidase metallopeptidase domain-containing protein n=1 Tax=Geodia barretti TaxID=519541 RepID=A0AA35R8L6_GEOBA|nr:hypothetical protein GBAR_LOCUS4921 [Geodia barretti]
MKCYSDWLKLKTTKDKQRKGGKLVAERKKQLWPSGSTMNVKFGHIKNWRDEDGEPITKDAILKIANKWHECNPQVVPKFIPCGPDNTDSDIRVEFVENGVSWSLVGAEAKDEDTNNPTMELDLGSHYRFTILHEFGHALGLQHEHQHPKAPKLYNEQMLNKFLKDNRGIKPEDVEQEKIDNWARLEEAELMGEYDEKSVMHYLIEMDVQDHSCTRGPTVTPTELSEGDKKYIVQFYSRGDGAAGYGRKKQEGHVADDNRKHGTIEAEGTAMDVDETQPTTAAASGRRERGFKTGLQVLRERGNDSSDQNLIVVG